MALQVRINQYATKLNVSGYNNSVERLTSSTVQKHTMIFKSCIWALIVWSQLTLSGFAQTLGSPAGPVILTITGAIQTGNEANKTQTELNSGITAKFDLAMLENIGLTKLTTETPWTKGLVHFEGVLGRDLMEHVGAQGSSIRASALNDYTVEIPLDDFLEHDVIIATRINGKAMRVRNNGPLWVIYPWSDNPALMRPHYFARSIWQLDSLVVDK